MALNFGEILEPSSRAFWDGFGETEDDASDPPKTVELEFNLEVDAFPENTILQLLLVIEGSKISDFIKKTLIGDIEHFCKIKDRKVSFYKFPKEKIILCLSEENDLNLSGISSELLLPWIEEAQSVMTISIQPKIHYKGNDSKDVQENISFMRGINCLDMFVKELEAPNFITGISAGVASWRYLNKKDYSCFVLYTDCEELDSLAAEPMVTVFKTMGLRCNDKPFSRFKDDSHLYM